MTLTAEVTGHEAICLLVLSLACCSATARAQIPNIPQGVHHETTTPENARYQIVQAQTAVKWTFRLDRCTGQIGILVQNGDGAYVWQNTKVLNPPDTQGVGKPRFQIFLSGLSAKFSFLLDTETGKSWSLVTVTDKAGKETDYVWQPFAGQ